MDAAEGVELKGSAKKQGRKTGTALSKRSA